ncbi:MAG: 2OG-Fe(II) oxygenase [Pseudomonadota bacterium]
MQFQTICINPTVVVADGVFDTSLADKIISGGRAALQRAPVVSDDGGTAISETRTNSTAYLDQTSDLSLMTLASRVSSVVRLPVENAEPCQLLHYTGPQEFRAHSDGFDPDGPGGPEHLMRGGQRLFTTICYLNDVPQGGETEFPELRIRVAARLGRVVIFGNTKLGTNKLHPHSLHAGVPVTQGEKWALTFWWRERPYHMVTDYPEEEGAYRTV